MKATMQERGVSKKMIDAERYVDEYIEEYGEPPTYRNVAYWFNLKSSSAAYNRLKRYRDKMKNMNKNKTECVFEKTVREFFGWGEEEATTEEITADFTCLVNLIAFSFEKLNKLGKENAIAFLLDCTGDAFKHNAEQLFDAYNNR